LNRKRKIASERTNERTSCGGGLSTNEVLVPGRRQSRNGIDVDFAAAAAAAAAAIVVVSFEEAVDHPRTGRRDPEVIYFNYSKAQ
jgi:hypothetical protein